jgi:hypothetical protein
VTLARRGVDVLADDPEERRAKRDLWRSCDELETLA